MPDELQEMFAGVAWYPVEQFTVAVSPYVVFPELSWIVPFDIADVLTFMTLELTSAYLSYP
jgi:hypothetical protein